MQCVSRGRREEEEDEQEEEEGRGVEKDRAEGGEQEGNTQNLAIPSYSHLIQHVDGDNNGGL